MSLPWRGLALAAATLALAGYVVYLAKGAVLLASRGERTTAVVVGDAASTSAIRHRLQFKTPAGREVETDSLTWAGNTASRGERVQVLYDPMQPQRASDGGAFLYAQPLLLGLLAAGVGYLAGRELLA